MKNSPARQDAAHRGHEAGPSSLRGVFIIASSVLVMLAACFLSTKILLRHFSKTRPMQPMRSLGIVIAANDGPLTHFPSPNLELDDGHANYMALRQRQNDKLNSYGWVDRPHGIARMPIERAMDLIVARGLPAAATNVASATNALNPGFITEAFPP